MNIANFKTETSLGHSKGEIEGKSILFVNLTIMRYISVFHTLAVTQSVFQATK